MGKKLEDYLHLYKKVPIAIYDGGDPVGHYVEGFDWNLPEKEVIAERVGWDYSKIKPILRPLDSLTLDEWTSATDFFFDSNKEPVVAFVDGEYKFAIMLKPEDVELAKNIEGLQDILDKYEYNDFLRVVCMLPNGNIAYGKFDFFPVDMKLQVAFINWLRNNFFDIDGLIEAGLALDKTKLPLEKNG